MAFAKPVLTHRSIRIWPLLLTSVIALSACAHRNPPPPPAGMGDAGQAAIDAAPPEALAPGTPDTAIVGPYAGETYDPSQETETGTAVGRKVSDMRSELNTLDSNVHGEAGSLQQLRAHTQAAATDYFNAVAAINAKLQVGTTTGNPLLVAQWNQAQSKLDALSQDVGALNALSSQIAGSASRAAYLLESVRATYGLSGAVDEDHVHLAAVEDDVNRVAVLIDRLLNEIAGDLNRQSSYVASERRNLQTLSLAVDTGEMYGQSLANRPYMSNRMTAPGQMPARGMRSDAPAGKPLVVIRFDRQNVNYQHAVYQAVSQALDRYPQASFDVVAVSPTGGNAAEGALASTDAKRNADAVARTLSQMGLPMARIHMSATTSSSAGTTEVRLYVH